MYGAGTLNLSTGTLNLSTGTVATNHHKFVLKLVVHSNLGDHHTNCTFSSLSVDKVVGNTLFTLAASLAQFQMLV